MKTKLKYPLWTYALSAASLISGCAHKPKTPDVAPSETSAREAGGHPKPEIYTNPPLTQLSSQVHLQTGRYAFVPAKPKPEQLNPLLTLIDVQIPESISTVKDSAQYLLQFSGYQLTQLTVPDADVSGLLRRTIPEVHRHFEAVILRDALLALAGNGYRLMVDPVHRAVAYARDPAYPGKVVQ